MREHGALGASRGTRGVDDGGEVALADSRVLMDGRSGGDRVGPAPAPVRTQRKNMTDAARGRCDLEVPRRLWPPDGYGGLGVGEEVRDLFRAVRGIQRKEGSTCAHGAEVDEERFRCLVHLNGHAIAPRETQGAQQTHHLGAPLLHRGIRERSSILKLDPRLLQVRPEAGGERAVEVHVQASCRNAIIAGQAVRSSSRKTCPPSKTRSRALGMREARASAFARGAMPS